MRITGFMLALAASLGIAGTAFGQAAIPADVTAPRPDINDPNGRMDIPNLVPGLDLPDITFLFDTVLDPNRVSLIEQVTAASVDDPRLTEAARSIIRNHLVAMQQVELAIRFLQANRDDILAGRNAEFNQIFGNIGIERDVAVTSPVPIRGLANVGINLLTGLVTLTFPDRTIPNNPGDLRLGDFVFVGDAPNNDPNGFIGQVVDSQFDPDGSNQVVQVQTPFGITTGTGVRVLTARPVFKVIRFDRQTDPARFDQVVQTFSAIRDALQGSSPGLQAIFRTQNPISYNRGFTDINQVWAPGIAPFSSLDGVVQQALSSTGLNSTRTADRLVRQAGLSNSDSHYHLDRLFDQGTGDRVDYLGRATFPLLWTQDNELPLNIGNNSAIVNANDEDRAFFRDRQTIFGGPDDPFTQYIGRAFLDETILHAADFFDDSIAADPGSLALVTRLARRPQRGPAADIDGNPFTDPDFENVFRPESGDPITEDTEFRKWQMIIESFAEHSTDLSQFNVAAVGLSSMFPNGLPDTLRASDAGNYARFASLIGQNGDLPTVNPQTIEPFGKRGSAGFNPVVPRN